MIPDWVHMMVERFVGVAAVAVVTVAALCYRIGTPSALSKQVELYLMSKHSDQTIHHFAAAAAVVVMAVEVVGFADPCYQTMIQ